MTGVEICVHTRFGIQGSCFQVWLCTGQSYSRDKKFGVVRLHDLGQVDTKHAVQCIMRFEIIYFMVGAPSHNQLNDSPTCQTESWGATYNCFDIMIFEVELNT